MLRLAAVHLTAFVVGIIFVYPSIAQGVQNMGLTKLQQALEEGLAPGGDLRQELDQLDDYEVTSAADARALCAALRQFTIDDKTDGSWLSPLSALLTQFQNVPNRRCPAFSILSSDGERELTRVVDGLVKIKAENGEDAALKALKILVLYGTQGGTDKVIETLQQGYAADSWLWSPVLRAYSGEHPQRDRLFAAMSKSLPRGFAGVVLLDTANEALIEGAKFSHPFDTAVGKQRLREWLTDAEPEHFSYAHSATAALPFISDPERTQLLALAMDHVDGGIQLEAAWASAKLGSESGIKLLKRACLDVNRSLTAQRYLEELGRDDAIPEAAANLDFRARAEFANWLAHPNELGRPPDEVEIVDSRTLRWPPDREPTPLWIVRYRAKAKTPLDDDDVDCGLVGSVTFCLFSYQMNQRPPEDVYAIHCAWELASRELIEEVDIEEADADKLLREAARGHDGKYEGVELVAASRLKGSLKYGRSVVALARAKCEGVEGWVVFDGPQSKFYAKAEFPDEVYQNTILQMHIGRALLGFADSANRAKFLKKPVPKDPAVVVAAYEALLAEAVKGDDKQRMAWMDMGGPLAQHFEKYVAALTKQGASAEEATIRTFDQLLALAEQCAEPSRAEVLSSLGPISNHFEAYVNALASAGQKNKIKSVVAQLEPHWAHNLGYNYLGCAAFKAGDLDTAERFLTKLRNSDGSPNRGEAMSVLAECLQRKGNDKEAEGLLLAVLQGLLEESRTATGSDKQLFEGWFQTHRATYLRLFPKRGEAALADSKIPRTTLQK